MASAVCEVLEKQTPVNLMWTLALLCATFECLRLANKNLGFIAMNQ